MSTSAIQVSTASDNLIELFQEDCDTRGLASTTSRYYCRFVQLFLIFLKELGLSILEVNRSSLKSYLSYLRTEKKLKQASIGSYFAAINAFFDFLVEDGCVSENPVPSMRKRYLHSYKDHDESQMRRIISIEEASKLVCSILDTRDKAVVLMLLKTGIRRNELCSLDLEDIDFAEMTIRLKPVAKRSNRVVYFDIEAAEALRRWMKMRDSRVSKKEAKALFLSVRGTRLDGMQVQRLVEKHAQQVGLHEPDSDRLEDRFTPHCCRHWFTTHLIRAGMPRDFVKELRGDARHDAIDIYNHIDKKELRESYLAHIPQLGI
jgi:integrase/recombinase XerD